jgi:hypothetical protein
MQVKKSGLKTFFERKLQKKEKKEYIRIFEYLKKKESCFS